MCIRDSFIATLVAAHEAEHLLPVRRQQTLHRLGPAAGKAHVARHLHAILRNLHKVEARLQRGVVAPAIPLGHLDDVEVSAQPRVGVRRHDEHVRARAPERGRVLAKVIKELVGHKVARVELLQQRPAHHGAQVRAKDHHLGVSRGALAQKVLHARPPQRHPPPVHKLDAAQHIQVQHDHHGRLDALGKRGDARRLSRVRQQVRERTPSGPHGRGDQ
eukprot:TRINITY_DN4670_c0_g2_i1.p2 TRINITY_DN4670_c0_g2~~TRINITY_DN4670_c0_g2_i1.p2  ORF type:complete len:217 (+),score=-26.50 TRINITY_DN4670_c0_g2_i1:26-676(+)